MAPQQADQQRQVNAGIVALAAVQTAQLWPQVDWTNPAAAAAVKTVWGGIVNQFGSGAAAMSAHFYDDVRAEQALPSQFIAVPADPVPQVQVDKMVDSAFLGNTDQHGDTTSALPVEQRVPARLDDSLQRLVLQPGRDTIAQAAAQDPAKPVWIRVPTGAKTCAFCVMLASRELGPNFTGYASKQNALFKQNGETYHKNCDCQAMPVFPGDNAHELSPNMADYQDMYYKGTADAGTHSDAKKILASMRQLHGLK